MSAIRREIKEVETQLSEQEDIYSGLNEQLRVLQQDRSNVEEELVAHNTRLRQMLDELAMRKEAASKEQEGLQYLKTSKRTMQELNRKVDEIVASVLEHKFKDDGFQQAIMEQNVGSCGDKVRVEFEGDEVFWSLRENYTFEMLLQDAARYWDVSPMDAALMDERGAIWPDDFYVALELQNAPVARILLRIKATAAAQEEEPEFYGAEDDLSEISDEEEQDFMAIAEAAEDELLLAQARGTATTLTSKQKLALRRKMRRELLYFLAFVLLFVYVLYARRDVRNGTFARPATTLARCAHGCSVVQASSCSRASQQRSLARTLVTTTRRHTRTSQLPRRYSTGWADRCRTGCMLTSTTMTWRCPTTGVAT